MQNKHIELSEDETAQTVQLLAKLRPGYLPYDIFMEICRLSVSSVVEVVPLQLHHGSVRVLLLKRPADDPYFSHLLHTPGTIVLATDQEDSYKDAFQRLLHDELRDTNISGQPHYVCCTLHKSERGMEDAKVYFVEVVGEPAVGAWYDTAALPDNLVKSQRVFIQSAARSFYTYKKSRQLKRFWH